MVWEDELDELRLRHELAAGLGGPEGIAKQQSLGKLTVLERLDRLGDPGTFRGFGRLRGNATYDDDGVLVSVLPHAQVEGRCSIDGRDVIVTAGDFTVRGGSGGGNHGALGVELSAAERAQEWRLPYVRLIDAAGGSVRGFEEIGRTYLPDGNAFTTVDFELLNTVPVVSAVLGAAAGLPALHAVLAHFNVMTERNAVGLPRRSTRRQGGDRRRGHEGGARRGAHPRPRERHDRQPRRGRGGRPRPGPPVPVLHAVVGRRAAAPRGPPTTRPTAATSSLLGAVPRSPRRTFDPRAIIESVVDHGSFFEIAPNYGGARVTGLARIDGYAVGVMANDPRRLGGATDVAAGSKAARLIQLCDTFHLPLVDFADEPGLMVGIESERQGIERAGARLVGTLVASRMP